MSHCCGSHTPSKDHDNAAQKPVAPDHAHHDHAHHDHGHGQHGQQAAPPTVKDPVCGMTVDPQKTPHHAEHAGQTYYFCGARCRERFVNEPTRYLTPDPRPNTPAAKEVPAGTIYTCPMHPQIRQVGPGSCPICGMALEPLNVTAESEPNGELIDMTRRFWIGLVLTVPVFLLEMGGHLFGLHQRFGLDQQSVNEVQLLLATPVVLWCGWPFFVRGWNSLV